MALSRERRIRIPGHLRLRSWMSGGLFPAAPALPALAVLIAMLVLPGISTPAFATADYARETGQKCSVCHISASGGGGLTAAGESYLKNPDNWSPPEGSGGKISLTNRLIHAVVLYAHVFFGIIWIGTIFYVHLVLKPRYALGGLPRSELRLAWLSMPVVASSGVFLTVWRLRLAPGLFSTLFGKLLLVKIVVFALMVLSAGFVTLYVGPRLKALSSGSRTGPAPAGKNTFTSEELRNNNGTEGTRALIAAHGMVYDVTSSPMWKEGMHARRHRAGLDLTEYLDDAPHDPGVLSRYEKVGDLVEGAAHVPSVVRIFTVNAYFNLIGCFIIILVLVLWRW